MAYPVASKDIRNDATALAFLRSVGVSVPDLPAAFDWRQSVKLPPLYDEQERIKEEALRFNILNIGRRAGKTYLGVHLALEVALDGHPVGWFSPKYKYVLEAWRDLLRPVSGVTTKVNATERRIELKGGGSIEVWTLEDQDAGRSRKYKRAIIDEAAMAANLKTSWEESIRPTLTDLIGDAWFLSTPKGLNYFHDLFKRGQDSESYPTWKSWQLPSSVNPFLPPAEIEAARKELPVMVFSQEYLAEFIQNEGAVFRNIDNCTKAPLTAAARHKGHNVVAGIDWGRVHDFTALSVICVDCEHEVFLDRFNQVGWDFQRERLLNSMIEWHVGDVYVESNSIGAPNLEALWLIAPRSIRLTRFETTQKSKPKLIQSLALALEKETVQWLPDPVARHELLAYEATLTEMGNTRYGAPEGGFDDTVIARCLAWKAASRWFPKPVSEFDALEAQLSPTLRSDQRPAGHGWDAEGWAMRRDYEVQRINKAEQAKNKDINDPWAGWIPPASIDGDPWEGVGTYD